MSLGQMVEDVRLAVGCKVPVDFYGRTGGVVPTVHEILQHILEKRGGSR
jgi:2-oxoglutarate ferredoxin oxidoreductase subunit alpha